MDRLSNKIRRIMNVTELVLLSFILLLPPSPQLLVFRPGVRSLVNFLRLNPFLIGLIRFTVLNRSAISLSWGLVSAITKLLSTVAFGMDMRPIFVYLGLLLFYLDRVFCPDNPSLKSV